MAINQAVASIIIVGGTDGPGIQLVPDGHGGYTIKRIPGWNPEAMAELADSLTVMNAASRLKSPGVAEQVFKSVGQLVQKQLGEHVGGGNVVVVRA